jgi:hypothetical protein
MWQLAWQNTFDESVCHKYDDMTSHMADDVSKNL